MTLVSHHGAPAPTYTKESYMGCEHAQAAGRTNVAVAI